MNRSSFRCLMVRAGEPEPQPAIVELSDQQLPAGEVTLEVHWSAVNYKDALAIGGHPGVVKRLPHVPGIDAAGVVLASESPGYQVGQQVLVTGYDFGQAHWGGWSQRARVPAEWVVPLPAGLSTREAMIYGTAGFTAAQCVLGLQIQGVMPESGEVVVTGASGGVGSLTANCPRPKRLKVWDLLATRWKLPNLDQMVSEIGLDQLAETAAKMRRGEIAGRVLVRP